MTMNEGWHRGKAIDYAINESDQGTTSIAVLLQVADGDQSGDGGKIISTYLFCTDNAIDNTVAALRLMGWTGNDLSEFEDSNAIDVATLLPNDVSFPINNEEYQGKVNAKVGKICKASSGKVAVKNKVEGAAAKSFGSRFKVACMAQPAKAGAQSLARPAPRQPPPNARKRDGDPPEAHRDNDDLPF